MFGCLQPCEVNDDAIDALVAWMRSRTGDQVPNDRITAGFTYLAQFIDHDITFDPTPLGQRSELVNFRTPRLDLDSVYGSGPVAQPFLYDWDSLPHGARLLVGHEGPDGTADLPRNHRGRALIGDARNDEHVIISQLHLLFIRFHNAVVDHLLHAGVADDDLFETARTLVRRHYQWIVVEEFLPLIIGDGMATEVRAGRRFFQWEDEPFIPLEFAGAAYRFGHSMVRDTYGLKRLAPGAHGLHGLPIFPALAGFTWLEESRRIDWERFFQLPGVPPLPLQAQSSFLIDTAISAPLFELPERHRELPRRNLVRGRDLGLPSGHDVACVMHERVLTETELELGGLRAADPRVSKELERAAPLWYYVLCEAAAGGGTHLGPVGGRIVGEVLVGLLEGDPYSYLREEPGWRPDALGHDGRFTMADLVRFAERA
jgi:hypothetical protein